MKFVIVEDGRNPVENLPKLSFVQHSDRRELGTPGVGHERLRHVRQT